MNNIDRAAQLLYNEGCGSGNTAHYIARRQADAGLLAAADYAEEVGTDG